MNWCFDKEASQTNSTVVDTVDLCLDLSVEVTGRGAHLSEALSTHHGDVGEGNGEDER